MNEEKEIIKDKITEIEECNFKKYPTKKKYI